MLPSIPCAWLELINPTDGEVYIVTDVTLVTPFKGGKALQLDEMLLTVSCRPKHPQ